ncbi:MAG: FHA domain-containing protein [Cyanothece sp. SIO2G6]|nr:FHA domain-containing protein [Cyanothece sp. SIO2G6]
MLTLQNIPGNDRLVRFLKRNPSLSSFLLSDCAHDMEGVTTIIQPVLQASQRCQNTVFFIQAVSLGSTGFLATNLSPRRQESLCATDIASSWTLGRGNTCAISMRVKSVSRCHAVITYNPLLGFVLNDLGSKNGTWVNGKKVAAQSRHPLNDGDLLQFGTLEVELFVSHHQDDLSHQQFAVDAMATTPG